MKFIKTTKKFQNSREVRDFFTEKKMTEGLINYKGGVAVVRDKRVEKIFVGPEALGKAKKEK